MKEFSNPLDFHSSSKQMKRS